jgi:hypothetical protein
MKTKCASKFTDFPQTSVRLYLILSIFFSFFLTTPVQAAFVPSTGLDPFQEAGLMDIQTAVQPPLDLFAENLANGKADQIVGVYHEALFAQKVIQQPANDAAYVSPQKNQITQFGMVNQMTGNLGLLAHNYLSGALFFDLQLGDNVYLVFGDGSVQGFQIEQVLSFQALDPDSIYSDFINLDTGAKLTASQLFQTVYGGSFHLTFQTCIREGDEFSWGRLFVLAVPVDSQP